MRMHTLLPLLLLALTACQVKIQPEPEPVREATAFTTSVQQG